MSDQAYGTQPGGETEGGTSPASGQDVSASQGGQPKGQEQQGSEQVITKLDLERIKSEVLEQARREAQSMTDKMGSRLDKEIQGALQLSTQAIEALESTGKTLSEQEKQAIKDRYINGAYEKAYQQERQSPPQGSAQQPAQPPAQDQGNQQASPWVWVNQEAQRMMRETGVYISPEDANKMIAGENGENRVTPYQYLQAFESLVRQRQTNTSQPQGLSPAIPSYVSGGKSPTSQTALRAAYEKERAQINAGTHPSIIRGDLTGIQRLEIAYRQKGLDI